MPDKFSFDAYMGWVDVTSPDKIPADARVISADDLLRYEKLGADTAQKFNELESNYVTAVKSEHGVTLYMDGVEL